MDPKDDILVSAEPTRRSQRSEAWVALAICAMLCATVIIVTYLVAR